ncbi:MAG TPA: hypothetical protein VI814_03115, partial [Candidatus Limnocylindria bacterium]
ALRAPVACAACGTRTRPVSGFCPNCLARLPAPPAARVAFLAGALTLGALTLAVDATLLTPRGPTIPATSAATPTAPAPTPTVPVPSATSAPAGTAPATSAPNETPMPATTAAASPDLPSTSTESGVRLGDDR